MGRVARGGPRPDGRARAERLSPAGRETLAARIDELSAARSAAGRAFFEANAGELARCCHRMAERFARGGRLIALGATPQDRSDARHVAVEFVHPVIVGKRALPAIALTGEGGSLDSQLDSLAAPDDIVMGFADDDGDREVAKAMFAARALGCLTIGLPGREADWSFAARSVTQDTLVVQELTETLYHVLWELVHVFFDHRGLLEGRSEGSVHDTGASSFLYPFLSEGETDLDGVVEDVAGSVVAKSEEIAALREQTLGENRDVLVAAAAALRGRFDAGGRLLAFGNGGSATDAADLVADLRTPPNFTPAEWPPRPAIDLTEDSGIITAVANDIGIEEIFQRQVIAYGREGDIAVALSTSGNSLNLVEALSEARRRGLVTVAFVGYDGGRIASEALADHVVVTRSQHIPRIQEAQASGYHVLRELIEMAAG